MESNGVGILVLNDSWKVVPRGNWQWSKAVHITPSSLSRRRYPRWRKKSLKYIWLKPFPNGHKCLYLKWSCQKLHTRNLLSYKKLELSTIPWLWAINSKPCWRESELSLIWTSWQKRKKKKKGGLAPPFCPLGHRLFLLSRCFWKAPWYSFYSFCNWCLVFVKGYVLAFLSLHGSCKKAKCKWPCQRRNVINVFVMLSKFLRNC